MQKPQTSEYSFDIAWIHAFFIRTRFGQNLLVLIKKKRVSKQCQTNAQMSRGGGGWGGSMRRSQTLKISEKNNCIRHFARFSYSRIH